MAHTIASLAQASGQAAKFFRLAAESGLPDDAIQQFIDNPEERSRVIHCWVNGGRVRFSRDMAKEDWTLIENVEDLQPVSIASLEIVPFLKDGEDYVVGEEMAKRAIDLHANLGQRQAEYMLDNHGDIPEEFRKYTLVFPGTKWRGRSGSRLMPYLCWLGERWYLSFCWLEHDFRFVSYYRLLRSRESYFAEVSQDK